MSTHAKLSIQNGVAVITLQDEVERHPCTLDWTVLREMNTALDQIEEQVEDVKAVVLESASAKSFVVGANIAALEELNPENIQSLFRSADYDNCQGEIYGAWRRAGAGNGM